MSDFLPFAAKSKVWEPHALELLDIAKCGRDSRLCPWELAPRVGLLVVDALDFIPSLPEHAAKHLKRMRDRGWSGGVLPKPLDTGHLVCILNPYQSKHRNKITLMEEVAHIHMDHRPTRMIQDSSGVTVRDYDKRQEEEAYGIGAAVLLPWSSFFHSINAGESVGEMSNKYEVSEDLVRYRIKITGATSLFRSRQKKAPI